MAGRLFRIRALSMRRHFFHDIAAVHQERVVGRPIGHFVQQRLAVVAPVEMVMARLDRGDGVVAELDELRRGLIAAGFLEDIADTAIALLVGQDFMAIADIGAFTPRCRS
jgi:hypothetical protein